MSESMQYACRLPHYTSYVDIYCDEARAEGRPQNREERYSVALPDMHSIAYTGVLSLVDRIRIVASNILFQPHFDEGARELSFVPRQETEWKVAHRFESNHVIDSYCVHRNSALSLLSNGGITTWNWMTGTKTRWKPPNTLVAFTTGEGGALVGVTKEGAIYSQSQEGPIANISGGNKEVTLVGRPEPCITFLSNSRYLIEDKANIRFCIVDRSE